MPVLAAWPVVPRTGSGLTANQPVVALVFALQALVSVPQAVGPVSMARLTAGPGLAVGRVLQSLAARYLALARLADGWRSLRMISGAAPPSSPAG